MKNNRFKKGPDKNRSLEPFRENPQDATLTTDQGVQIEQTDDSLHGGSRGPTLLEDFHLREKITRFEHERIPERVVHARGTAPQGVCESLEGGSLRYRAEPVPIPSRSSRSLSSRSWAASASALVTLKAFHIKFSLSLSG